MPEMVAVLPSPQAAKQRRAGSKGRALRLLVLAATLLALGWAAYSFNPSGPVRRGRAAGRRMSQDDSAGERSERARRGARASLAGGRALRSPLCALLWESWQRCS